MSDDLSQLKLTLERIRLEFNQRIDRLEERLEIIEYQSLKTHQTTDDGKVESPALINDPASDVQENQESLSNVPEQNKASEDGYSTSLVVTQGQQLKGEAVELSHLNQEPKPSRWDRALVFLSLLLDWVQLSGPIKWVLEQYQSQKSKGNGPVFLMTASGIVISVVGFGYLLQYMIGSLPAVLRVSFGYLITAMIFAIGFWLKKQSRLGFTSSIFGLAILLGQTNVFFTGPYFNLISPATTFFGFATFTLIGYVCAYWLHAHTLAMIALVGGVFLPWLSHAPEAMTLSFTAYLFVLNLATLHLANRLNIRSLVYTATLLTPLTLQAQLMLNKELDIGFLVLLHAFFILYVLMIYRQIQNHITVRLLTIISANLTFFVCASIQWFHHNQLEISWIPYGLMTAFFVVMVALKFSKKAQEQSPVVVLSILQAGVLLAITMVSAFGLDGSGAIATIEALLLISIGARFRAISIRAEGYVIYVVSLAVNLFSLTPWVLSQQFSIRPEPAFFIFIGLSTYFSVKALATLRALGRYESMFLHGLKEIFSLWLMLLIYGIFWFFLPEWLLVCAALQIPIIVYRHSKENIPLSEASIYVHYFLLSAQWVMSAEAVGTLSFRALDIYGKVAILLGFTYLLLIPRLYQSLLPQGNLQGIMRLCKVIFFLLLPLFFLPSIARHHEAWLPIALWFSVAISLGIYYKKRQPVFGYALMVLGLVASFYSIFGSFEPRDIGKIAKASHLLALGVFVFLIVKTHAYRKPSRDDAGLWAYSELPSLQFLVTFSYYWAGCLIFLLAGELTQNAVLGLTAVMSYLFIIIMRWKSMIPLRRSRWKHLGICLKLYWFLTLVNAFMAMVSRSSLPWSLVNAALGIITLMYFYYGSLYHKKVLIIFGKLGGKYTQQKQLMAIHVALFIVYIAAIERFLDNGLGPGLTVAMIMHFIFLLFYPVKRISSFNNKFAIMLFGATTLKILLFDLADFSIIEKIISFIVIGVLLLIASFQYQKRSEKL